jgi:hypothetical protein
MSSILGVFGLIVYTVYPLAVLIAFAGLRRPEAAS